MIDIEATSNYERLLMPKMVFCDNNVNEGATVILIKLFSTIYV